MGNELTDAERWEQLGIALTENRRQAKALQSLIESPTVSKAAERAGISRKTMYHYLKNDPAFQAAYTEVIRTQFYGISEKLNTGIEIAIDFVTGYLQESRGDETVLHSKGETTHQESRVNTALKFLDIASRFPGRGILTENNQATITQKVTVSGEGQAVINGAIVGIKDTP